jgi:hypothetical protein
VRDNRNTSVQTLVAAGPVAYDFFNYAVNATGAIVGNVAVGGAGGGDAVFGSARTVASTRQDGQAPAHVTTIQPA